MNMQHYQFRLEGLSEPQGQIRAADLYRVLDGLLKTAERATRLAVTGESKGGRAKWLEATLGFVVTGIGAGSTVLEIDAPELGQTAREQFQQSEFWREAPRESDTALTLAALAIEEALGASSTSERFDAGVLEAVLELRRATQAAGVVYRLVPTGAARGRFELGESAYAKLEQRRSTLPEPRAFLVSGRLDRIEYSKREFLLLLARGQRLRGRIHPEFLSEESLRDLWGKPVTLEGMVHFMANGAPRFIEARKLGVQAPQDAVFEEMPRLELGETRDLFPELVRKTGRPVDPMALWNTWPGDESIDELMAELD